MRIFSRFFKTLLLITLVLSASKGWQLITDGFRKDKIKSSLSEKKTKHTIDLSELESILSQEFKYLSKGCQTYVFESKDHNYVIKFVRYHRHQIPLWLKISSFSNNYKAKRLYYKSKLLSDSLNSYHIANKYLKDETATIFVHLNKTNHLNKKLKIIDRLNRKYLVDLDKTGFILQKKVKTFESVLKNNKNDEKELKRLTSSFLHTTKSIYEKGYINDDYNCVKNSGVIGQKVIHTDLGSFLKKDKMSEKETFENEFNRFVIYFKKWAEKNAPFLITYVDEEIQKMSSTM